MARVAVIGGGFGSLAAAARLAKQGHEVSLFEAAETLGGAVGLMAADGFTWDAGPTHTLLPAVIRDLFRKSGLPAEREFELVPRAPIREHRWPDGSALGLPGGSRSAQMAAFDALSPGAGDPWAAYVDAAGRDWDLLRRVHFEAAPDPAQVPADAARRLRTRRTLAARLRTAFADQRLRDVAAYPLLAGGQDPRRVPEWLGVASYLEQRFGAWGITGGMGTLANAMTRRLATRRVAVHTATRVHDITVRGGRAVGVATSSGEYDAEVVVCGIDPRLVPALAPYVRRTSVVAPPRVVHLGLAGEEGPEPAEIVLHGSPTLIVRTGVEAPPGRRAVTVLAPAGSPIDVGGALAARGLEVRDRIVTRLEGDEMSAGPTSSPMGVAWRGRATVRRRLGPATPVPGAYLVGAHATPGAGLHFVGLSAAMVAEAVGKVPRRTARSTGRPSSDLD